MTTTYSPTLATTKDQVRLEIGDTANFQLQDEEITYVLSNQNGNVLLAASDCARMLAARHAGEVDRMVGQANIREGDRQKHYLELAATLFDRAVRSGASPYIGGLLDSDKSARAGDVTYIQPRFRRELP